MSNVLLKAERLEFSFGERLVLNGVDLTVQPGEVVALLGRNGAGKTTLLKMLNGLLTPARGTVMLGNRTLDELSLPERARRSAYVPQSITSAFPMRVIDVVLLGRRPYVTWRLSKNDIKIASDTLATLGLDAFAFRRFTELSGGERQQVVMAKALAQEASLLLLDEPTVGLDVASRKALNEHVRTLCEEDGLTVLWATHLIEEVREEDRVLILHQGQLLADGNGQAICDAEGTRDLAETFHALTGAG